MGLNRTLSQSFSDVTRLAFSLFTSCYTETIESIAGERGELRFKNAFRITHLGGGRTFRVSDQ
jgi:hypothetical protein